MPRQQAIKLLIDGVGRALFPNAHDTFYMSLCEVHDICFVVYDFNRLRSSVFTIDWTILIITIRLFIYFSKVIGPIILV